VLVDGRTSPFNAAVGMPVFWELGTFHLRPRAGRILSSGLAGVVRRMCAQRLAVVVAAGALQS
jgi:hypothetical protein